MKKFPPIGDPRRAEILAGASSRSLHLIKREIRERARESLADAQRLGDQLTRGMIQARSEAIKTPLSRQEKLFIWKTIESEGGTLLNQYMKKEIKEVVREITTIGDILGGAQSIAGSFKMGMQPRQISIQMEKSLTQLGIAFQLRGELAAHGINAPIEMIHHALKKFAHDLDFRKAMEVTQIQSLYPDIANDLIHSMQEEKRKRLDTQRETNLKMRRVIESGAISRFTLPRKERREIYRQVKTRADERGVDVRALAIGSAYSRSRSIAKEKLSSLGLNAEKVLFDLGISKDSVIGVRRLKLLFHVLRVSPTSEAQKQNVKKLLDKYGPKVSRETQKPVKIPSKGHPAPATKVPTSQKRKKSTGKPHSPHPQPPKSQVAIPRTITAMQDKLGDSFELSREEWTTLKGMTNHKMSPETRVWMFERLILGAFHFKVPRQWPESGLRKAAKAQHHLPEFNVALDNLVRADLINKGPGHSYRRK